MDFFLFYVYVISVEVAIKETGGNVRSGEGHLGEMEWIQGENGRLLEGEITETKAIVTENGVKELPIDSKLFFFFLYNGRE